MKRNKQQNVNNFSFGRLIALAALGIIAGYSKSDVYNKLRKARKSDAEETTFEDVTPKQLQPHENTV